MQKLRPNLKGSTLTPVVDILMIACSYLAAYLFRFMSGVIPTRGTAPDFIIYGQPLLIVIPIYLLIFRAYGLYDIHRRIRRIEEIFQVIKAVTFSIVILMAATFFYRELTYSRVYLFVSWLFSIFFISCGRYFLIQWEYRKKVAKKEISRVLLIGANRQARQIIRWAKHNPHYGQEIVGILAKESEHVGKHLEDVPILGVSAQCEDFILKVKPDQVVLMDASFPRQRITELVVACEDQWIEFKVVADVYGLMTQSVQVEYISTVPLLGFKALPLDDVWNRLIKRTFDIIASLAILITSSPLWLLILALIKLDDRGPIFYRQERVGRDHRTFNVLKFRTMKVDAEAKTGPVWARAEDDRRTRLGNFLRRWNLDEIPQILNVLKGEMSLVGPRPERPHFVNQFRESIPRYMARHKIKSGLTGWAQVNGYRGNTSIQERIKYDIFYMENWSLLFDIEILFMTFSRKAFKNAY